MRDRIWLERKVVIEIPFLPERDIDLRTLSQVIVRDEDANQLPKHSLALEGDLLELSVHTVDLVGLARPVVAVDDPASYLVNVLELAVARMSSRFGRAAIAE